jgi:type IV pilus assembly protein PilM
LFTADSIWGLDIGDSGLKAVKLSNSKGETFVEDYGRVELDEEIKKSDGYLAAVEAALEKLTDKKDFQKTEVCISISAKNANSQFISLESGLSSKKFAQEVKEEAERQIPFPLDEVEWGIHKMAEGEDQVQVALFASRTEYIQKLLAVVDQAGLQVRGIQVPGVALYNFVTEVLGDGEDHLVLLDFGEKSTGLVLMYDDQFWIRSLPLSGQHITQLLEKKFRITTQEAATLKREMGKSAQKEKLFRVIEPKLKELVIEIKRSINFRRTQSKGLSPKKFLAWGGCSQLPGVSAYFSKTLGLEVSEFKMDSLDFSNCQQSKELIGSLPSYGVAFGLALQGLGRCRSNLNLIPKSYLQQEILKTKRWAFLAVNVALLILAIVTMFAHDAYEEKVKDSQKDLNQARSNVQREIDKFAREQNKIPPLVKEAEFKARVQEGGDYVVRVYGAVMEVLEKTPGVYLTEISLSPFVPDYYMHNPVVVPKGKAKPKDDDIKSVKLSLAYVSDSASTNSKFTNSLMAHPLFSIGEGLPMPRIKGSLKDFEYSYSPKVELEEGEPFKGDPQVAEIREEKEWVFDVDGIKRTTQLKKSVQSLDLQIPIERFLASSEKEKS